MKTTKHAIKVELFDVGDMISNIATGKIHIVTNITQSYFNVFNKEFKYIGNVSLHVSDKLIYDTIIGDVGETQQLLQSVEEMTELNKEILKYIRYQKSDKADTFREKIIEELGDVFNALNSLKYILGITDDQISKQRYPKLIKYYNSLL